MIVGASPKRPAVFPVGSGDWQVIDARDPSLHEASVIEFPVLVAVRSKPVPGVIVPLVGEANGDAVALTCPELLYQAVIKLLGPLPSEELLNGFSADYKLRAVAPHTVGCVGQCNTLRIAGVPGIFGHPNLLRSGLRVEWRQG